MYDVMYGSRKSYQLPAVSWKLKAKQLDKGEDGTES